MFFISIFFVILPLPSSIQRCVSCSWDQQLPAEQQPEVNGLTHIDAGGDPEPYQDPRGDNILHEIETHTTGQGWLRDYHWFLIKIPGSWLVVVSQMSGWQLWQLNVNRAWSKDRKGRREAGRGQAGGSQGAPDLYIKPIKTSATYSQILTFQTTSSLGLSLKFSDDRMINVRVTRICKIAHEK